MEFVQTIEADQKDFTVIRPAIKAAQEKVTLPATQRIPVSRKSHSQAKTELKSPYYCTGWLPLLRVCCISPK
jgi:hypothetical protein